MIMIQAIEKNFDELLSTEKPLMDDFGAEWRGPCDVEENNNIALRYSIRNIPTVIFFMDGKEVGRQVGAIARNVLKERIRDYYRDGK